MRIFNLHGVIRRYLLASMGNSLYAVDLESLPIIFHSIPNLCFPGMPSDNDDVSCVSIHGLLVLYRLDMGHAVIP